MNYKLLILLLFTLLVSSCKENDKTTISGNIPNLPDGTLYLYKDNYSDIIDSVYTRNGKFQIIHEWKKYAEPIYLGLDHIDKSGVKRSFSFVTHAKYKGSDCQSQYFFSDPIILVEGNLKEFESKNTVLDSKYKLVTSPKISAGMQTKALYDTDCDLFDNFNAKTVRIIKQKINSYPYSYHLLYKINENKNSFSPQQIDEFLKLFDSEITKSDTYKRLSMYNEKSFNEKNVSLSLLEDKNGEKKNILNKNYKKHLIIFWASWCGPCRQEIPLLKKIHSRYRKDVEFVSISIDTDRSAWEKALKTENMNWKQLIANHEASDFEALQIRFKLNEAIPYTILVDNNMKRLGSFTGLSNEKELQKLLTK